MVTFKNLSRFYSRNTAGKYQLDVGEIRAGFLAAETAHERLRRFRAERLARILAGETPIPLVESPRAILHAVPVSTSEEPWQRFGNTEERDIPRFLPPPDGSANAWRFNLDGFVTHTLRNDPPRNAYAQLFRNGGIEAVSAAIIFDERRGGGFYGQHVEASVLRAFGTYQQFWAHVGVEPPLVIGLALAGVRDRTILHPSPFREVAAVVDRDPLVIPEIVTEDLSADAATILRPLFNLMWNAGGWSRSPYYDDSGQRKEPRS